MAVKTYAGNRRVGDTTISLRLDDGYVLYLGQNHDMGADDVAQLSQNYNLLDGVVSVDMGQFPWYDGSAGGGAASPAGFYGYAQLDFYGSIAQEYGLRPTGGDDTVRIQNETNRAAVVGGAVWLAGGDFTGAGIVVKTKVHYYGAGEDATRITLKAGANTDLFISENFAARSLSTGGDGSNGGIHDFSFQGMTLDGNWTNNSSGWVLRYYGLSCRLSNIVIRLGFSGGLWSEWYNGNTRPAGADNFCESYLNNFKIHSNHGPGIVWMGPHDSMWVNGIVYQNSNGQPGVTDGIQVFDSGTSEGGPLQMHAVHSWGSNQRYALNVNSNSVHCMGCTFEGATGGAQIKLDAHKFHLLGGEVYRNSNTRIASTSTFTLASSTTISFADTSALATSGGLFHGPTGVQVYYTGKTPTSVTGVTVVRGMSQTSIASGQTWSSAGVGILWGDGTTQNYGQVIIASPAMATLEFAVMAWGGADGGKSDMRLLPFNVQVPLPTSSDCTAITTGIQASFAVHN